jgi:hypothetical protein
MLLEIIKHLPYKDEVSEKNHKFYPQNNNIGQSKRIRLVPWAWICQLVVNELELFRTRKQEDGN